jgi:hypothetical protein
VKFAFLPGLAVLNPLGKDPDQLFQTGIPGPDYGGHPPLNYHAYAACTRGGFYRTTASAGQHRNVLLLLRRDLVAARKAFTTLKAHGCVVAISFKESGTHQLAAHLADARRFDAFCELAADADLCLSSTPDLLPLYSSVSRRVAYLPTPYPVDEPAWDLSLPLEKRAGIFIGTREFDVLSRNHLLALTAVRKMSHPSTVVDKGSQSTKKLLAALRFPADQLTVLKPMDYPGYLQVLRRHRLVLQFDQSRVPGQVAGDALLCGIPTVGSNGAIEREILPELVSDGQDFGELLEQTLQLLRNDVEYRTTVSLMLHRARERISFSKARTELAELFPGVNERERA